MDLATKTDEKGLSRSPIWRPAPTKSRFAIRALVTVLTDETIRPGQKRTMKYFVEEKEEDVDEEVVVRAARIKKEAVETRIRTEEARKVPGTQGDTLKVVQNLPGVGRASFGSGQLVVWGSSPKETRVIVEGVEIPDPVPHGRLALDHQFRSGQVHRSLAGSVWRGIWTRAGRTGAHRARPGSRLGRARLRRQRHPGHLGRSLGGRHAAIAFRRRRTLELPRSFDARGDILRHRRLLSHSALRRLPSACRAGLRKDEDVTATFLASDDHLRRTIPASDPADLRTENDDSSFRRFFVTYSRLFDDGSSVRVTPSFGFDNSADLHTFGDQTTQLTRKPWHTPCAPVCAGAFTSAVLLLGMDVQGQQSLLAARFGEPAAAGR